MLFKPVRRIICANFIQQFFTSFVIYSLNRGLKAIVNQFYFKFSGMLVLICSKKIKNLILENTYRLNKLLTAFNVVLYGF